MPSTAPDSSPGPVATRQNRSLVITAVLITAMALLALFVSRHHARTISAEAELQSVQLDLLERTLESESTIARAALDRLGQASSPAALSAVASLQGTAPDGSPVTAIALWSDTLAVGHLVLPPELVSGVSSARIAIHATVENTPAPLTLTVFPTQHSRVIGFRRTEDNPVIRELLVTFTPAANQPASTRLAGSLQR